MPAATSMTGRNLIIVGGAMQERARETDSPRVGAEVLILEAGHGHAPETIPGTDIADAVSALY